MKSEEGGVMEDELFGFTINEIGKIYKVTGNNCPDDMEITVKKEQAAYIAECNYSRKGKSAASDYQAMRHCSTPEETIKHLLMSLEHGENWVNASSHP
jgi:hypothetical protein